MIGSFDQQDCPICRDVVILSTIISHMLSKHQTHRINVKIGQIENLSCALYICIVTHVYQVAKTAVMEQVLVPE